MLKVKPLNQQEAENKMRPMRYGVAVLAAVVAVFLRKALSPFLGDDNAFITLWPAVVFATWYCGVGPSLLSVFIGLLGVWVWILPPYHSFALQHPVEDLSGIAAFLVFSGVIIAMGKANHRTRNRERELLSQTAEATAKFRAVFDQSAVFAGVMTVDGTLIDANRLSLAACGYLPEEVLGVLFWETPWWRKDKSVQEKIRAATSRAARGEPYREELPYWWADGSERVVDFALHPIRDGLDQVIFLHPTGTDITDRNLAEEKIRKLTENLEVEVESRTRELEDRNSDVLRQSDLLRILSRRLIELQDSEQRRIARELHDSAGQLLSLLSMRLSSLARDAKAAAADLGDKTEECGEIVKQITQEIRTMSYLLHPPLLDEVGLSAALDWYVKGLNERSGLEIALCVPKSVGRLPRDLELAVFRVIQECLTNIHRHSGSKTASISITLESETLLLEVRDQGKGIPPEKLSEINSHGSGVGMQGIRERLRPYHGKMRIDSGTSGTVVYVTLEVPGFRGATDLSRAQAL